MIKNAIFFTLLACFCRISSFAQKDTLYIKDFHDKLIIKPFIGGPQYKLTFDPKISSDSVKSIYTPNTYGIIGIDIAYKSASLSLSKRAGDVQDENIYGKTKYTSISAKFGFKKTTFEAYYKNYKGYADLNTPNYYKSGSYKYLIRNDLQNKYYKLKVIYQFSNKKYSYPAAFSFTERQRKSALTLMMMGNVNRFFMSADSSFFPHQVRQYYDSLYSMNNIKITSVGGAIGGGFNIIWKQFFFSGILFTGIEFQHQKYFLTQHNEWRKNFTPAPVIDSRFSIGMNGNRAFFAITAKSDYNVIVLPSFTASTAFSMITLDFGYRFKAPKILEKTYNDTYRIINKII